LDTLALNDDLDYSAGTISLTGFERISLLEDGTNDGVDITIANANLTGQSFIMTSDELTGQAITTTVSMAATEAISDLSGLVFDATFAVANDIFVISNNVTTNLTLTGSDMIDQFTSGAGDDTMSGGAGADVLNAAAGDNTVNGGAGDDTITTTTGADTIDGGAGADTINSGAGIDTITAGEGADIVYMGADGDTVDLTETTSAGDNVQVVAITDGSAAGAAAGTFTGFNVITGFVSGTDDIVFDGDATNGDDSVDTDIVAGTVFVKAATDATTASNDLTSTSYTDVDSVVNYYNDLVAQGTGVITSNNAADDLLAVTIGSGTAAFTAIYSIDDDSLNVDATEVMLVATVDATLVSTDIIA